MPAKISASVGVRGVNRKQDVQIVQSLLNGQRRINLKTLVVDGLTGPNTNGAITAYQTNVLRFAKADGRVDPGGKTLASLNQTQSPGGGTPTPTPPTTPPSQSVTFMQRVTNFTNHVQTTYGITINVRSSTRQPLWQQRMHVAHMIKYNSYRSLRPRHNKSIGGHYLIGFSHLSSHTTAWGAGLDASEYLRDAANQPCLKAPGGGWANAPDEAKTRARAYQLLSTNGIGTAKNRSSEHHSAMVAPGVQGCAEPCLCGGSRSKHLSGVAVDLDSGGMTQLRSRLSPSTDAKVDELLAQFGLHRPMTSEPWHVESTE